MRKENQELRERVAEENEGVFPNYFERRLVIEGTQFVIVPNGGTGDCLFKAIAQAISEEDDETKHLEIRCQIVDYIVQNIWEKLRDSIEIQHVTGNADLIEEWFNDPIKTYTTYMTTPGNLGSFIELTAAAELLQFNFASIQEYSTNVKTYRVENFDSRHFHHRPIFHFLFTGDYESGHWEHLVPIRPIHQGNGLADGTYSGTLYIVIDGVQTSLDDWMNEMEEWNKRLKNECKNSETCSDQSDSGEEEEESNPDMDTTSGSANEDESTRCHESGCEDTTSYGSSSSNPGNQRESMVKAFNETDDENSRVENNFVAKKKASSYSQTNYENVQVSKILTSSSKGTTSPSTKSKDLLPPVKTESGETDKKKGCLRSIVSYVSSILR